MLMLLEVMDLEMAIPMENKSFSLGKEFIQAFLKAQKQCIDGIVLTNSDPEADYLALVEKTRPILEECGFLMERVIDLHNDGSVSIALILLHVESGQFLRSQTRLRKEKYQNRVEKNSRNVFIESRYLYEGLLGIASSNCTIEAELFGPKRKHRKLHSPYDKTADFIYFDCFNENGKPYKRKVCRREFERLFLGMTTEEEAIAKFEIPVRREFSWSDIKLFMQCKRCFFNKKKLGVTQPKPDVEGFALPLAIDALLKKEFDQYRVQRKSHSIMPDGLGLKPLKHKKLKKWQTAWSCTERKKYGIQFDQVWENWFVNGGIDDVWINDKKELVVVEYKTIVNPVISSDFSNVSYLHEYKKQIEFYAWIFKKNNYTVCSTGYLLLCNAITNRDSFDWKLEFEPYLLAHEIDDSWVQKTIYNALESLQEEGQPIAGVNCKTCKYFDELTAKIELSIEVT